MSIKTKLFIFPILFVLFSCKENRTTDSIEGTENLSKYEMLEDYDIFRSIFEQANAGLYKYRTKAEIDSVFDYQKSLITEDIGYREFYNILWDAIDFTGSSHNALTYPNSLDKELSKQKIFFPLPLKFIEGKLLSNLSHKEIPIGSELISINGIESSEFSQRISKYVSTDGFNTTGKYANIGTDWLPFFVYLALGPQEEFKIEFNPPHSEAQTVTLSAIDYDEFYKNFKNRHSKIYENNESIITFKYLEDKEAALLKVGTFAIGGPSSEIHKRYSRFLDSIFMDMKQKNIPTLIVDIRGNGGGDDPNDILLYSYLTKRDFRENTSAFTLFNEVPYPEYYDDDDLEELEEELKQEHSILKDGKYYQNDSFNGIWNPNKNAFQEKIILLIDPFVASAGSLFASLVKSDNEAIVIGEETLGGYYGHTGHIPMTYQLPNSKLYLTFSIVDLDQDVQELPDQKLGEGVKPDFEIGQSHQDFMNNKDTQLEFAIDLIERESNSKED